MIMDKIILTQKEYQELNDRLYLAESQMQEWENHIKDGTLTIKHKIDIVFQSDMFTYVDAITSEPIESHDVNTELGKFGLNVVKQINAALKEISRQYEDKCKNSRELRSINKSFWKRFLKFMGLTNE